MHSRHLSAIPSSPPARPTFSAHARAGPRPSLRPRARCLFDTNHARVSAARRSCPFLAVCSWSSTIPEPCDQTDLDNSPVRSHHVPSCHPPPVHATHPIMGDGVPAPLSSSARLNLRKACSQSLAWLRSTRRDAASQAFRFDVFHPGAPSFFPLIGSADHSQQNIHSNRFPRISWVLYLGQRLSCVYLFCCRPDLTQTWGPGGVGGFSGWCRCRRPTPAAARSRPSVAVGGAGCCRRRALGQRWRTATEFVALVTLMIGSFAACAGAVDGRMSR